MPCKSCGLVNQKKFAAEISLHFLGLKNADKPTVWVFPEAIVCLDCGVAEFAVPEAELCQLAKGDAASTDLAEPPVESNRPALQIPD